MAHKCFSIQLSAQRSGVGTAYTLGIKTSFDASMLLFKLKYEQFKHTAPQRKFKESLTPFMNESYAVDVQLLVFWFHIVSSGCIVFNFRTFFTANLNAFDLTQFLHLRLPKLIDLLVFIAIYKKYIQL